MYRIGLLAVLCTCLGMSAAAQSIMFGSSTDPTEGALDPLRRATARVAVMGGPSYVGVRWRGVAGLEAEGAVGPFAVSLEQYVRVGHDGLYEPDFSEPYDALRTLRYARIDPTPRVPLYLRFGPLRRTTLDTGLLVRDYGTVAAWDERTIGVEVAAAVRGFELGGFASDVRMDRVVGAFVAVGGTPGRAASWFDRIRFAAHAVHDLSLDDEAGLTALGASAGLNVVSIGDLGIGLTAGHARYLNYGHGTLAAVHAGIELFDIGLASTRLGLLRSSAQFIPGFINAFYDVNNPHARIVSSEAFFADPQAQVAVGAQLQEAEAAMGLDFELHIVAHNVFEVSNYFRREFGRPTGAFGVRLALAPDRGRSVRFLFDLQRQGLSGFTDIFRDLVDEAILTFRVDYAATNQVHVFIRSRYGYRHEDTFDDGTRRYLIERRFEPMVGLAIWR